ncbi:MAG: hypothetical protein LBK99_05015, partial [Opitutaceae bacterium]|nr:hypothetical protein [Opitutaceae bacterium]
DHGVPLAQVEVRTDLGTEFDGDTVHYRPDGFHRSITAMGALHRLNPPARPNANADVESSHSTIEPEFFDLEHFHDTASFIASSTTYQHFFNFARKNRSRSNLAPADLLAMRSPLLHPRILLLPPVFLDSLLGQDLSAPPDFLPFFVDFADFPDFGETTRQSGIFPHFQSSPPSPPALCLATGSASRRRN